jgi:hypothetical protein
VSGKPVLTLLDVAAVTTSDVGPSLPVNNLVGFVAELRATEDVASTSLDVVIEDSFDGGATWNDWIVFTQLTTTGNEVKSMNADDRSCGPLIRAKYTIVGGTWTARVKLAADVMQ